MTDLLVSVRSIAEFQIAAQAGVRFIDVKEPERGSLGAASLDVVHNVAAAAESHHEISVAMGELLDGGSIEPHALPTRTNYAKLGLAGCRNVDDWRQRWEVKLQSLPQGIAPVAVAYADWQAAQSPQIEDILEAGIQLRCSAFLIDTFEKSRGTLLSHLPLNDIVRLIARASGANQIVALAGSLDQAAIRRLQPLGATLLAVRSAACRGQRTEPIDASAIRELCEICS